MILYFTATGNSLYVAKHLDEELLSIPQEINRVNRHYKAKKIGIICPLFEFEIPQMVKDFIKNSTFETNYLYLIITYGCHNGGVAQRTNEFLKSINIQADYINTIIMHDNAIIVFDMDQQRAIESSKNVDEHIAMLKTDIDREKRMIQKDEPGEIDFYHGYIESREKDGPMFTFPLYTVTNKCIECGTCAKVCPRGCIHFEDRKPVYNYSNCVNCMACIQACSTKAIQFASIKEPNPNARYRHPQIKLSEIIQSNNQRSN